MSDETERTLYAGRMALRDYALLLMLLGLLMLLLLLIPEPTRTVAVVSMLVVLGVVGVLVALVRSTEYTLTQRRAVSKTGIFTRKISEVELADVRNVQVKRNLLQRMVGVGDVGISTAGQGGIEVRFQGRLEWEQVAEIVRAQRRATTPAPRARAGDDGARG